jgi:hypothetical protein
VVIIISLNNYTTGAVFTTLHLSYECAQQDRALHDPRLERLARYKTSSLFGPFITLKKSSVVNAVPDPWSLYS